MSVNDPINWMLSEALGSLARAERLHQQFFTLQQAHWEPPIDVLETDGEILIFVALPGVDLEQVEAIIEENGVLVISGSRTLPAELRNARIHRLELPQGNFLRRIALPIGRYAISRLAANGCIVFRLAKAG